jgi:predicted site-specific integrase-resolvase
MTERKPKRTSTLPQAATLMGIDRNTIRRWCMSGAPHDKVPCPPMRSGFLYYVDVAEVRAWRATKPPGNRTAFIAYAVAGDDA